MADKLAKLRASKARDLRILFLASVLLPAIALGLRVFGFRRVQAVLARWSPAAAIGADSETVFVRATEVARLVAAACRYGLYRARCLPISLTLGWLLQREGISTDLRLGVRKADARLEAHAWIEHRGVPLIDTPGVHQRFAAFGQAVAPRRSTSR